MRAPREINLAWPRASIGPMSAFVLSDRSDALKIHFAAAFQVFLGKFALNLFVLISLSLTIRVCVWQGICSNFKLLRQNFNDMNNRKQNIKR
jgi:hypothetical protein